MIKEEYFLTETEMRIIDEELGLDLTLSFPLPRLPEDLSAPGVVLERDEMGQLVAAYFLHAQKRHGACRLFYPSGAVRAEMFYANGILHGPSTFYSEENSVLTQTWYVEGKKSGKVRYFYLSGALASLLRYREGVPHGMQEYWYEDAQIKSRIPYEKGQIHGEVQLFWPSGKDKRICHFSYGKKEGIDRLWNEAGTLIDEGSYTQGKPMGIHRHFFADGTIKEEVSYPH